MWTISKNQPSPKDWAEARRFDALRGSRSASRRARALPTPKGWKYITGRDGLQDVWGWQIPTDHGHATVWQAYSFDMPEEAPLLRCHTEINLYK